MALSVPFGRFLPGETCMHRLDARVKIVLAIVFMYAVFAQANWWALLGLSVFVFALYHVSHVPTKLALGAVKPLFYILVFTVLANGLTFQATSLEGAIPLIGIFGIKPDGLAAGLFYSLRIALLVMATSLVTFTTSPVQLADGFTSLMRPLSVFKVPVEDIATMFSIALRFIPVTAEEAERIMTAQKARGARFGEGGLVKRARAWTPVLVPLFVGLFRDADDLAGAMDARCYMGQGRTRLHETSMRPVDWAVLIVMCAACIALGVLL